MKDVKLVLLVMMLAMVGISFISCDKGEDDENGLGASRPIYEDYRSTYSNLHGTNWSETVNGVKTTLRCIQKQCTFSYSNKPSVMYDYYFESGNAYFTPSSGTGDKLRGTFTLRKDYKDILDIINTTKNVRLHILNREL